jgi:hypothetical protein
MFRGYAHSSSARCIADTHKSQVHPKYGALIDYLLPDKANTRLTGA